MDADSSIDDNPLSIYIITGILFFFALAFVGMSAAALYTGESFSHWISLLGAMFLSLTATALFVPRWRYNLTSHYRSAADFVRSWFGYEPRRTNRGSGSSTPPVEKPAQEGTTEEQSENALVEMGRNQEVRETWNTARGFIEEGKLGMARALLDGAKDHQESFIPVLVTSGYCWWVMGGEADNIRDSIRETREAIRRFEKQYSLPCVEDTQELPEEFHEQYFVANSNLSYYLAYDRTDPETALEAGRTAEEGLESYPDRDSFVINYAYARMRFAEGKEELIQAIVYLANIHLERDLAEEDVEEVNSYVREGLEERLGDL